MPHLDRRILIENIQKLIAKNNMTQQKLANVLGMSQPNVCKALSYSGKKYFTLEQIVDIADYFGVSVDSLIGNSRAKPARTSPRAVGTFIAELIQNDDAIFVPYQREEDAYVYECDGHDQGVIHTKGPVDYLAILLPSYWKVPIQPDTEEAMEAYCEATAVGNETRMQPVNDFFHKFNQIHQIYKKDGLEDDTYTTVVTDLLGHLRDN